MKREAFERIGRFLPQVLCLVVTVACSRTHKAIKAAEQGDIQSQFVLGAMYWKGQGVPQDEHHAAKWFRKAAQQGDGDAPFLLGCLYLEGKGATQSNNRLRNRLTTKRSQGSIASLLPSTRHSVRSVAQSQKVVHHLSTKMTPGQINQAERLATQQFLKHRPSDV